MFDGARLPVTVLSVTVSIPPAAFMIPPPLDAVLSLIVLCLSVAVLAVVDAAAVARLARLPVTVLYSASTSHRCSSGSAPMYGALLPLTLLPSRTAVPKLTMPPE